MRSFYGSEGFRVRNAVCGFDLPAHVMYINQPKPPACMAYFTDRELRPGGGATPMMISLTQRRFLALTSPNESSLPNLDWSLAFFRLLRLFN